MPDLDELFPGRFLKGRTLEHPMTIRIVGVGGEPLEGDDGDAKLKGILRYVAAGPPGDDGKPTTLRGEMVLAKTNALLIAALFGRDYTSWSKHTVTIGFDPSVKMGAETVGGIRVVGSPELKAPKRVEVKRPRRRKPEVYMLQPTDNQGRVRSAASPAPSPEPPPNEPPADRAPGQEG